MGFFLKKRNVAETEKLLPNDHDKPANKRLPSFLSRVNKVLFFIMMPFLTYILMVTFDRPLGSAF